MTHPGSRPYATPKCFWGSRYSIGLVLLGAIAAYLLFAEHRAHVLGTLPLLLLLLACPLIHAFMHRGHAPGRADPSTQAREGVRQAGSATTDPPRPKRGARP